MPSNHNAMTVCAGCAASTRRCFPYAAHATFRFSLPRQLRSLATQLRPVAAHHYAPRAGSNGYPRTHKPPDVGGRRACRRGVGWSFAQMSLQHGNGAAKSWATKGLTSSLFCLDSPRDSEEAGHCDELLFLAHLRKPLGCKPYYYASQLFWTHGV